MNFIQSPPVHYPNSQDSTIEVFRTRNFSINEPPAYGDRSPPPRYQESSFSESDKDKSPEAAARARRIRIISISASVLIVATVALVVAAVVSKISTTEAQKEGLEDDKAAAATSAMVITTTIGAAMGQMTEAPTSITTTAAASSTATAESHVQLHLLQEPVRIEHVEKPDQPERPICGDSFREFKASGAEGHTGEDSSISLLDCVVPKPELTGQHGRVKREDLDSGEGEEVEGKLPDEPAIDEWEWDSG